MKNFEEEKQRLLQWISDEEQDKAITITGFDWKGSQLKKIEEGNEEGSIIVDDKRFLSWNDAFDYVIEKNK